MLKMIVSNLKPVSLLAILVSLVTPSALAQNGNAYGGLINNQVRQQMYLQDTMPYLMRPTTEQDLKPGPSDDEPVIMYSEQDVQGKVIPNVPSANDLHVK